MSQALKILIMGDASNAKQAFAQAQDAAKQTATAITAAVTAAAASFALVETAVIQTSSEFENFQIRLNHVLGSVAEGNRLFQDMTKFASSVPFSFQEIMGAATQMSGVMAGGVDEVNKWMPMIADLAAVSGLSIQQTTEQVVRMYSAGAASADLFRERGITAMLGFQAGVHVSAADTRKQLIAAFEDPASKFRGAANDLATTWTGTMSMMGDQWTLFQKQIGDDGAFVAAKNALKVVLDEINNNKDATKELSAEISGSLIDAMQVAIFAAGEFGKAIAALSVTDDLLRLGIDKTAGVVTDAVLSEMKGISGLLMMVNDITGHDFGIAGVEDSIAKMEQLKQGIAISEKQSAAAFGNAVDNAANSISKIQDLSQKLFLATDAARSGAQPSPAGAQGGTHTQSPSGPAALPSSAQTKAAAAAEKVRQQLAALSIEKQRAESLSRLAIRREELNKQKQLGLISGTEEIQALKALSNKSMAIELKAAKAHAKLIKDKPVQYQKAMDKIEAIQRKHDLGMKKMQTKAALEQKKFYDKMFAPVTNAFQKSINGMIQGTLSFRKAMKQMGQSIVLEFANMGVKMVVDWVKNEALKTSASLAGTAVRTGAQKAGAAESLLISAGTAVKQIMMDAWSVMAAVYKAIASIPVVGPFLAPIAAAGAFGVVAGYASNIASASGGFDIPSGVNPMTQLHQQEMVLPAHIANPLRDMIAGGGQPGGNTTQITIQAMDARSFKQYLTRNASSLPPALKKLKRNFAA